MVKLSDLADLPPTLRAKPTAELLGVSEWTLRESVRAGTCPVRPLRIGRRMVWPTAQVLAALGIEVNGHDPPAAA